MQTSSLRLTCEGGGAGKGLRGGLGRGASGRRAGAGDASPHKGSCGGGGGRQSQPGVHGPGRPRLSAGLRVGGRTPALLPPGHPAPPAPPAAARSPGGMEQGRASVAEPRCRRYTPAKHPASWGLRTSNLGLGLGVGAQGPPWGWGDDSQPPKTSAQPQGEGNAEGMSPKLGFTALQASNPSAVMSEGV